AFVPALCDSPYVAEKLRSGSVDFAVPPLELFRMPEEGTVVLPCAPEWKATPQPAPSSICLQAVWRGHSSRLAEKKQIEEKAQAARQLQRGLRRWLVMTRAAQSSRVAAQEKAARTIQVRPLGGLNANDCPCHPPRRPWRTANPLWVEP
ncbi:MAG: hypothetical protein SGPRY_006537, partial [Prymnesium sp.]